MGDVAIAVHVVRAVVEQNKDIQIVMLTRKAFQPLFSGIERLSFIEPDLKGKHHDFLGLLRLYREINKEHKIDVVVDIHNVLRSKLIRRFFRMRNIKIRKINKGRTQRRKLINKTNFQKNQLKTSLQKYAEVFLKAGINVKLQYYPYQKYFNTKIPENIFSDTKTRKIGIAPFAFFKQKMYPQEKMEMLISLLCERNYEILIFGGGENEKKIAEIWQEKYENVKSVIGNYSLLQELAIINNLDLILTMDSANMHIAALTNTKILTIWGATHTFAGFAPFVPQERYKAIEIPIDELACRPCSIYGKKECRRGDLACLQIPPEKILEKIDSFPLKK